MSLTLQAPSTINCYQDNRQDNRQIIVNNYYDCKVDLSPVFVEANILKGLAAGYNIFGMVAKEIWFDPLRPENHSVRLLSKDPLTLRLKDGNWRNVTDPGEVEQTLEDLAIWAVKMAAPFCPCPADYKQDNVQAMARFYLGDALTPGGRLHYRASFIELLLGDSLKP